MNQQEFVDLYEDQWLEFETLLEALESRKKAKRQPPEDLSRLPFHYRRLCQQLALARDRDYAAHLIDRLNQLVLRGHQQLYQARAGFTSRFAFSATVGFPNLVRKRALLFWLAAVLMFGPTIALTFVVIKSPDFVYAVMDPGQVDRFEEMYRTDSEVFGREREADTDFYMFGFYIRNNIGVGFRTFAGGLLFGVGSVVFLVVNGTLFGAIAGHVVNVGYAETFFSFVIGHGAFELTAIVLAGMAGLNLGWSLIAPGRLTRLRSLREAAKESVQVVYGVVLMLVVAAFVEAFWSSSSTVPPSVKFLVGTGLWVLVAGYFLLMGRGRGPQ